jgi:hypothetical protein
MRIASSPPDSHSVFNISGCFLRRRTRLRTRVRHRITSSMIPGVGPAFLEPARRRALPPTSRRRTHPLPVAAPAPGPARRPRAGGVLATPVASPASGVLRTRARTSLSSEETTPGQGTGRSGSGQLFASFVFMNTSPLFVIGNIFRVPLRGNTLSGSMRRLASLTHFRRSARLRVKCPGTARRYPGKPL